ncbi:Hint domain-containing protein [Roseisalinus antarcticus]|uniref:Hedgehog/Intein (Hint) domain-containing protein n=1 Tax=Roseisalinus antarcticus TaxID=254357 RepID=A0A1Y5TR74_9RHOB|nr:Hint domain-containing protein [Roseisalinus antarcticus]SLN70036.1 hypothetical protein ROA7023_03416 [Roseisalinus antarcticus]
MVLTFDGGMQPVVSVRREILWAGTESCATETWPLHVPAGALGNRAAMTLLPSQPVLIESDTAEALYGDPFALVPASALEGYKGITRTRPGPRIEVVVLVFEGDEIVFGNMGALFHCPAGGDLLEAAFADEAPGYRVLGQDEADALVTALEIEEGAARPGPCGLRVVA